MTMVRALSTAVIVTAFFAFSCAVAVGMPAQSRSTITLPQDPPPSMIAGTSWRFVEIMGAATPTAVQPTLAFSADGVATGDTGCNQFSGRFVSSGTDLSFSDLSYTKMMCGPDVMAVEMAVQQTLERSSRMASPPGGLELFASDGTLLARLTAAT
ncbi:META domain-containing protein [Mycobacterium sp. 23]|uniref:META domain-containing protein n=1 Tax=Mycobacterium sp. 23 TaxID=3400424 RepID=UPI003AB0F50D